MVRESCTVSIVLVLKWWGVIVKPLLIKLFNFEHPTCLLCSRIQRTDKP